MSIRPDIVVMAAPSDGYVDFCLWDYEPLCDPSDGWASETLLLHSFDVAGVLDEGRGFVQAVRKAFGRHRTVWGIKEFDGGLSWEFYFYDYNRAGRSRSASRFLNAVADRHSSEVQVPEARPYFMFSVAFTPRDLAEGRPIRELDLYIGNPGSTVSSGICYLLEADEMRLKNFYFFFDAEKERTEAMRKLSTSAFSDASQIWPAQLAWPEMMDCKVIVVANKKSNDALYFSRVRIKPLAWFLERVGFRDDILRAVQENSHNFNHLYFDVGYDFVVESGNLKVVKSSFYGYF